MDYCGNETILLLGLCTQLFRSGFYRRYVCWPVACKDETKTATGIQRDPARTGFFAVRLPNWRKVERSIRKTRKQEGKILMRSAKIVAAVLVVPLLFQGEF